MSELCPECNIELTRNLSKPGIVGRCKKCKEEFIFILDKWITMHEFHARADAEHN
jgi:hypothetical protein